MTITEPKSKGKSFLTPTQIAKIIGVCTITIRRAIAKGQIPAKKIGRFHYVPISFLDGCELETGKESCNVPTP